MVVWVVVGVVGMVGIAKGEVVGVVVAPKYDVVVAKEKEGVVKDVEVGVGGVGVAVAVAAVVAVAVVASSNAAWWREVGVACGPAIMSAVRLTLQVMVIGRGGW